MEAASPNPEPLFTGAANLLKFGPLGLAGLMLVLVIIALAIREMSPSRERLLRQFMYIGAFCFALAGALSFFAPTSVHMVHFHVEPLDEVASGALPPPKITINSEPVKAPFKYPVKSEVTAIINVSDAIQAIANYRNKIGEQAGRLKQIGARTEQARVQLGEALQAFEASSELAVGPNCSGGASGIQSTKAAEIAALNSVVASKLGAIEANMSAVGDKLVPFDLQP